MARGTVALNLGLVYWHEGQLPEVESVLKEAQRLAELADNQYGLAQRESSWPGREHHKES